MSEKSHLSVLSFEFASNILFNLSRSGWAQGFPNTKNDFKKKKINPMFKAKPLIRLKDLEISFSGLIFFICGSCLSRLWLYFSLEMFMSFLFCWNGYEILFCFCFCWNVYEKAMMEVKRMSEYTVRQALVLTIFIWINQFYNSITKTKPK